MNFKVKIKEAKKTRKDSSKTEEIKALRAQVTAWETELSAVMPKDFKDWWKNSKSEWPLVARCLIESLREREKQAQGSLEVSCEEAFQYLEENGGRLTRSMTPVKWPDGTRTEFVWQYADGELGVLGAKTAMAAIRRHMEVANRTQKEI